MRDSDGDGVIDSEDYAPRDPDVQREEQVELVDSTSTETTTETQTAEPTETQTTEPTTEQTTTTTPVQSFTYSTPISAPDQTEIYTNTSQNGRPALFVPPTQMRIAGATPRDAGTELTVQARSTGGSNPFLRTAYSTVDGDNLFYFEFDLSDLPPRVNFDIIVESGSGETLVRFEEAYVVEESELP
jgi:hypothetical protein